MERVPTGDRRLLVAAAVVAALGALAWTLLGTSGGSTARAGAPYTLDHFLCYQGAFKPSARVGAKITLRDQFGRRPVSHTVGAPKKLCNPTQKLHPGVGTFPIVHPNNHLTAYNLSGKVKAKKLRVNNQFQKARSSSPPNLVTDPGTTRRPTHPLILVPTRKDPHPAPADIDHFKCYPTKPKAINQIVAVRDQFPQQPSTLEVQKAVLLCNPAKKVHGNRTSSIKHRDAHLVCYTTTPFRFTTSPSVRLRNQFGRRQLVVRDRIVLCVPSRKSVVS